MGSTTGLVSSESEQVAFFLREQLQKQDLRVRIKSKSMLMHLNLSFDPPSIGPNVITREATNFKSAWDTTMTKGKLAAIINQSLNLGL